MYSQWGPFKRWLRWRPEHPWIPPQDIVAALDSQLAAAMKHDDARGGTGEWVALLGFSQGAKIAASLLYRQQVREEAFGKHRAGSAYQFGVLLAGRAPLVSLDSTWALTPTLPNAAEITDSPDLARRDYQGIHVLRIPTLHVHGLRDPGRHLHRQLFEDFCDPFSRILVEWDGEHRLPLKLNEVSPVVCQIRELAKAAGILQ